MQSDQESGAFNLGWGNFKLETFRCNVTKNQGRLTQAEEMFKLKAFRCNVTKNPGYLT